jgi:transposase
LVVHYASVIGRGELTDRAWAAIRPLLPKPNTRNGKRRDHRQVINGILWKLRTGAPWRDLPERYGPWKTCLSGCAGGRRRNLGSDPGRGAGV